MITSATVYLVVLLASSVSCSFSNRILSGKGCTAVTPDKCGTDWYDSCLKCGDASDYDCEKCCPGCALISKDSYKFCDCKGPSPAPSPFPPAGGDSWDRYTIDGMDVTSVTGGSNKSNYEKVIIMLHGGGGSGSDWQYNYEEGWFGNLSGLKYVFPTSTLDGHVWYKSFKNGCGLDDDCAYNISSIHDSASHVASLIDHEKSLVGGVSKNVFLAGFSEGAQLTGYMQIAKLDYALGGTIVMDGFPLPPLCDMPGKDPSAAKQNATYFGQDMRWMIWHGSADPIFPVNLTINAWNGIFKALEAENTIKIKHVEPGMTHTLLQSEFKEMITFIRN